MSDSTKSSTLPSAETPNRATASCFCSAVQLSFPTTGPGIANITICNCTDCRKITASMFASNFSINDDYLIHERGQSNLKTYSTKHSVQSGKTMTNYFCQTCGTLMYRVGERFPGWRILRLGTLDDLDLVEGVMKPRFEQFVKSRAGWLDGPNVEGVQRFEDGAF
ncbi:hypothetical protein HBI24_162690 [Parastagonospora nodorum]|nr:hypothetical protein HBI24_162690 [Parastagonospora nodorum]